MSATSSTIEKHTAEARKQSPPPLENGDRLTAAEFERRWEAMPELKRAELIEGIVHMPSPTRLGHHSQPHLYLDSWLGHYISFTPGVVGGTAPTVRLDNDNEPQPDALLKLPAWAGGQSKTSEEGYQEGPPELAAEVAASSVSIDMHRKKELYRRHGVREYVVWRVYEEQVDWFVLREGKYEPLAPQRAQEGNQSPAIFKSEIFPGLWLDPAALIRGDLSRLFELLRQGAATEEHAALVKRLGEVGRTE